MQIIVTGKEVKAMTENLEFLKEETGNYEDHPSLDLIRIAIRVLREWLDTS